MRARFCFLLPCLGAPFWILLHLTRCVKKLEHDPLVYFFISILCFFLFYGKHASCYKSVMVRGAVMECLAVTEELLAKDCSSRWLPGGRCLWMSMCLLVQPCTPGLTLAFLCGSPGPSPSWPTKTMAHKLSVALPGQPDSQHSFLRSVFV